MECVFCKIVKGELPSYRVYEDERCIAFLDINPISRGHTLVVPKEHVESFSQATGEIAEAVSRAALRVARAIKQALKPEGINYFINEGSIAGQVVMHLHLHIVPRYSKGEVEFKISKVELSQEEMEIIKEEISRAL